MWVSLKELTSILNTLPQFLKQYDKNVKVPIYHLPKPKQVIGFTLFENELFPYYFQDIKEHCNRQISLSFRFERNRECCFAIKEFQIVGEQNVLTEIVNLRHCKMCSFQRNSYYIASKCRFFDSNYDMWPKEKILAQLFYQDQKIVELMGDVICANKKCRGKKCVYLTSFEEVNRSTYECKQCKVCSHVLIFPFKDQKPCITLFGWTGCLRKKTKLDYQKEKLSPLMRQYICQSKPSTTKAEEAKSDVVPRKAKISPFME